MYLNCQNKRSLVAHLDVLTDGSGKPDRPHLPAALCAVITVKLNKQHEIATELNLSLTLFAGLLAGFGLIVTHFSISTQFAHPAPIC